MFPCLFIRDLVAFDFVESFWLVFGFVAVQYRYNSLVDGTGPPMYKYVIPYTTYHLNTSHIYHFFVYMHVYIYIHIYILFFHISRNFCFFLFFASFFLLWRGGTRLYNTCICLRDWFHCFVNRDSPLFPFWHFSINSLQRLYFSLNYFGKTWNSFSSRETLWRKWKKQMISIVFWERKFFSHLFIRVHEPILFIFHFFFFIFLPDLLVFRSRVRITLE